MNFFSKLLIGAVSLLTIALVAQAQTPGVNSNIASVFNMVYEASTTKPTYSASFTGITAVSSQTDQCSITGSASKTVRVRRVFFTNVPTAAVTEPIAIVKRSTASTGTGLALTKASYDSNNGASSIALAEYWTAAPTVGTLQAVIADVAFPFQLATGATPPASFEFGRFGSPVVLRGVAQSLSINLNGVTFTGTVGCTFEWTEE